MRERNPGSAGEDLFARYLLDVAIWELDPRSHELRSSLRLAEMVGCAPGDLGTLEEWMARIDERDRRRVELELRTHVEGLSDLFETEYRMRHKDGSLRWMRAKGLAQRDEHGAARAVVGHQEEITQQRTREEALTRSESRFRALVEDCPEAVAVHRNGRFAYLNRRMAALLGHDDATALVGSLLLESIHPDDVPRVIEDVRRLARRENESLPPCELRFLRRDGEIVTLEVSSLRLELDGEPSILVVARDVSERKRLQARMAQLDRMANLGTLAAGVAHEINNPLAYVSSNLQMMEEHLERLSAGARELRGKLLDLLGEDRAADLGRDAGPLLDPTTFDELLTMVRDATQGSQRVQAIVGDLRHFARPHDEERSPVEVAHVLEMALKMAGHELKYRARITQELRPVPLVLADPGRLCQVFLNLLMNAAQAIPPGRIPDNEIRIVTRAEGPEVVVEIQDTGSGIATEHLHKVFDPFFTTKPAGVGSGLGLSICQHIVEDHSGRIDLWSEVGRGTRVAVRLPVMVEALEPAPTPAAAAEEPREPGFTASRRHRILIVDDEIALLRALSRDLSKEFDVVTASDGRQALDILGRDRDFALVLCDMMMLEISGEEVYEWARGNHPELAGRIVFMTGGATTERTKAFLDEVDNIVLDKPVDLKRLRKLVRNLAATAPPSPASAPMERRQWPRFRALGVRGVLSGDDRQGEFAVVDYSLGGLRVSGPRSLLPNGVETPLSLVLLRSQNGGRVQAEVRLVRRVHTDAGTDLCFQIQSMDSRSRDIYRTWLSSHAQGG